MQILDPKTGDQTDEHGTVLIPYEVFRQRQCNRAVLKNEDPKPLSLPKPVEMIEPDWDDVPVYDRGLLWGEPNPFERQRLLNRLFEERALQGDPGDENDN